MKILGDEAKAKGHYRQSPNIWKDDSRHETQCIWNSPQKIATEKQMGTQKYTFNNILKMHTHAQVPAQIPIQRSGAPLNRPAIAAVAMTI